MLDAVWTEGSSLVCGTFCQLFDFVLFLKGYFTQILLIINSLKVGKVSFLNLKGKEDLPNGELWFYLRFWEPQNSKLIQNYTINVSEVKSLITLILSVHVESSLTLANMTLEVKFIFIWNRCKQHPFDFVLLEKYISIAPPLLFSFTYEYWTFPPVFQDLTLFTSGTPNSFGDAEIS